MNNLFSPYLPFLFPIFFVLLWLSVTIFLGFISGWYGLMERYPDRSETPLVTLPRQSGSVGSVRMRSILNLSVCPSGLRIGIMRVFGVFCRDFFVPWEAMTVSRKDRLFWKSAKISIGHPAVGSLTLPAEVTDRVARAAAGRWPEAGSFPEETSKQVMSRLVKQWAAQSGLAAAFFIITPRLMSPKGVATPPIAAAILFPAIVFGCAALVQYIRRPRS